MKLATPRIQYAVPQTLEKRLEILHAMRTLGAQDDERLRQRRAEIAAIRRELEETAQEVHNFSREWPLLVRSELRKAEFNPDEPRVPAGNPGGGEWTAEGGSDSQTDQRVASDATPDDNSVPGAQYASNQPPGVGQNPASPLDEPPKIPPEKPATAQTIYAFLRAAAYWLAEAGLAGEPVGDFLLALQVASWLSSFLPYVYSYLDQPKTLKELQQDALNPEVGYNIHHIVEQTSAAQVGFPDSMINGPDNLVRISTLKHWQINAWYSTPNPEFGGLSPRDYLRGKQLGRANAYRHRGARFIWSTATVRSKRLADLTVAQLVDRFATIGVEQNKALLYDEFAKFTRLYWQMDAINNELKSRPGDQRSALTVLFNHPDVQVRLKAAVSTMEIVPQAAREVLQGIVDARRYPQAADALAAIWRLDGKPLVRLG